MISSILVYIGNDRDHRNWLALILGISLPVIMAGFRSEAVGTDTENYQILFEEFKVAPSFLFCPEPFYYVLSLIAAYFDSFKILLLSYQFFSIFFIINAFRNSKNNFIKNPIIIPSSIVLLLYFFILYNASLNIMRQITAVCYFVYISQFIERKILYIFLVIIGLGWHSSIILPAGLLFISYRIAKQRGAKQGCSLVLYFLGLLGIQFIIVSFLNVLSHTGIKSLAMKGAVYSQSASGGASWSFVLTSLLSIALLSFGWKYIRLASNKKILILLIFITELSFYLTGNFNPALMRLALYFTGFYSFFIPQIITNINTPKEQKMILYIGTIWYFLFYWWYINVHSNSGHTIPYELS